MAPESIWFSVSVLLLVVGALGAIALLRRSRQREALLREALGERDRLWAAVRVREENVRSLVRGLPLGVTVHGRGTEIVESNALACRLLGRPRTELLGMTCHDPQWGFMHQDGSPLTGQEHPVAQAMATRRPVKEVVVGFRKPGAWDPTWLLVSADPQRNETGAVDHVVTTLVDLTDQIRGHDRVEPEKLTDPVTGCFNRDFLERFERIAVGDQQRWGCVIAELGGLARISGEHGDEVAIRGLKLMARFLMMQLRAGEALVRLGEREFLAVLTGVEEGTVELVVTRIREQARTDAPMAFAMGWAARNGGEPLAATIARAREGTVEVEVSRPYPGGEPVRRF